MVGSNMRWAAVVGSVGQELRWTSVVNERLRWRATVGEEVAVPVMRGTFRALGRSGNCSCCQCVRVQLLSLREGVVDRCTVHVDVHGCA